MDNPTPRTPSPKAPDVPVAESLQDAHAIVQRLGRLLARAKTDTTERITVPGAGFPVLAVSVAAHRRALLLLDAVCRGLVSRGHDVALLREKKDGEFEARLCFAVSGTEFEAALVEKLDKRERPRTKEEERSAEIRSSLGGPPPGPMFEYFPSGRLQLVIRNLHGPRSSWSDGKTPLEKHLGRVVVALEVETERRRLRRVAAEQARMDAEERRKRQEAEAERRRLEAEAERRRHAELEARRQHELGLARDLRSMARRWAVAAQLRSFIDAVEQAVPVSDRGEGFSAWLRWAGEHAEGLDPLNEPHKIGKALEADLGPDSQPSD